jgi:thiol-disulfide isomerase/thioredoxin
MRKLCTVCPRHHHKQGGRKMNLVEYLKQQKIIPQAKADKFIELLDTYEENDVLYDSAIKQLDLTNEEFEKLFMELEKENYLDRIDIITCPYCDSLGNTYVEKFDIPEVEECRFCHTEFNYKENHMEAFRLYFNYHKNIDILTELSQKINYNQERIFEIVAEIKELETKRKSLQGENIRFVTLRNELMYDKNESKAYKRMVDKYKDSKVKYIGTLIYMKKSVIKCKKCNETFELFNVDGSFIGVCPTCDTEIELLMK